MTFLIIALVAVVAVLAAGAGAIAIRQKQLFATSNQIVPGRTTAAPAGWAGAHSPEAKLHRRLGEAVAALRANPTLSDGAFMESRAAIETAAQAIDERLIAAAALPRGHREAAIAAVEPDVVALEASIASLAAPAVGSGSQAALDDSVRSAQIRLDALSDARAEIERLDGGEMPAAASDRPAEQPEAQARPVDPPPTQAGGTAT